MSFTKTRLSLALLAPLLLAAGASAQTTPVAPVSYAVPDESILSAYQDLATKNGLCFLISGQQVDGNVVTPIFATLFYQSTTDSTGRPQIKINLKEWYTAQNRTSQQTLEIVGDGKTLFTYRANLNPTPSNRFLGTYSAVMYDAPPATQSTTYASDLIFALSQAAPAEGRSSYAVRLLRELFESSNGVQYHDWVPFPLTSAGLTQVQGVSGGPWQTPSTVPYFDPIRRLYADPVSGQFAPTPPSVSTGPTYVYYNDGGSYATYGVGKAIAFELNNSSSNSSLSETYTLSRIYFTQIQNMPQKGALPKTRVTAWTLSPIATSDFSTARFTPYLQKDLQGWRNVVATPIRH